MADPQDSYPRQRARTRGFRLGAPRALTPSPDGERVAFLRSRGGTDPLTCLWVLDVASGTERCVVDPSDLLQDEETLPPEERARRERMREVTGGVTDFSVDQDVRVAVFALSGVPYAVRLDDPAATVTALDAPGPVIDPRPDPTGTKAAFVSDRALYVAPLAGGRAAVLCRPETDTVTWGLADFIGAEELDRVRGYWWLADGSGLLVERFDDSPVATWWVADPAHPDQAPAEHRYPAAGTDNADVSLWLVRIDDEGEVVHEEIDWDHATLPYLATVSTSSGGDPIVSLLSRDQRRQVVLSIDPETGASTVVRERTDPDWIDVLPGVPARGSSGALVEIVADRSADTNRLVVDDVAITPPGLQVEAVLDAGADDILVIAGGDPVRSSVCRISPDGAVTELLTGGSVGARRSGALLCTAATSLDSTATDTAVWREGERIATVRSYAEIPIIAPRVTMLSVGERDLRTAVLFPSDHVPGSRRLPVIMSPYGGPHARMAVETGLMYGTAQWLADQGYCVVVSDGRGTPGRGPAWDRTVRGDLATPALEDQVAALAGVAAAYPDDVDTSRVGIRGWSFGGFLAALGVLRRPDVFHAAVAGAPVTDWRLYDTGYTERYLGLPQDDPDAYDTSSLIPLAPLLTRPLLIIHGLADDNVVVANTLQFSSALLTAGRPHAVLPLSGVTHMTPQEAVAENLLRAEVDFFASALGR